MKKIVYTLIAVASISAVSCKDNEKPATDNSSSAEPAAPLVQYTVVNKYPHDTASFTQGLVVYKGQLYESTGNPSEIGNNGSWVGPVDLASGKGQKKATLDKGYFGEGMTILHDKVYYITWQSKKGFVYDLATFKKIKEFSYNTEGWGLTNDGTNLIMSDGSNKLYYYSPDSLRLLNIVSVYDHNGPVPNINELEYINGSVFANQWETPYILRIDPSSGKVTGRLDLTDLFNQAKAAYPDADVLNGIAYDSTAGKIYVTGKKWPNLYEIRLQ